MIKAGLMFEYKYDLTRYIWVVFMIWPKTINLRNLIVSILLYIYRIDYNIILNIRNLLFISWRSSFHGHLCKVYRKFN